MKNSWSSGFSLIELVMIVLVLGIVLAFAIPNLAGFTRTHALRGSVEAIAADLRYARERAIAQNCEVQVHYHALSANTNWHYHVYPPAGGTVTWGGKFKNGVSLQSAGSPWFTPDGRSKSSATIVLSDVRGNRDTVSVLTSGLVLIK